MKILLAGECNRDNIFTIIDPASFINETAFEAEVVKALTCFYPNYWCGVFSGSFTLDGDSRKPDLALIHKNVSHWFIIEVELTNHSLEHHVLPQVRSLRYGEPDASCISSITTSFSHISRNDAKSILRYIPRYVAVISNLHSMEWEISLKGLDVQYSTVSVYQNISGKIAHEIEGRLLSKQESIGFAQYSEIDKCLRIKNGCGLPEGNVRIIDQFGNTATWTIHEDNGTLWIAKDNGPTFLKHQSYVQIIRTCDGEFFIRQSD